MDPSSPVRVAPTPGVLHPISPERMNQQRLPQSPSLPGHLNESKHHRMSSDVQSKVAFLNTLSRQSISSPQPLHGAGSTTAALQRAILGREEAETALSELRVEMSEAQIRERRISERLESLMEELQSTKERQAHERQVYEKEIKRSRKDAFRAGSALVKLQEDLKEARSENKSLKAAVNKEKFEKEKSRQEAFERAYTLAGLTEEMHALKEKLRATESQQEVDVLNQQVDELQTLQDDFDKENSPPGGPVKDASTERRIQEPDTTDLPTEGSEAPFRRNRFDRPLLSVVHESESLTAFGDTLKPRRETFFKSAVDEDDVHMQDQIEDLKAELAWERRCKEEAEDLVHFMNMECQFRTCACRRAEAEGLKFVHDWNYENKLRAESAETKSQDSPVENEIEIEISEPSQVEPRIGTEEQREAEPESFEDHMETTIIRGEVNDTSYTPLASPTLSAVNKPLPASASHSPCTAVQPRPDSKDEIDQDLFDIGQPTNEPADGLLANQTEEIHIPPLLQEPVSPSAHTVPLSNTDFDTLTPARPITTTTTTTTTVPLRDHDEAVNSNVPGTPITPATLPGTPISREAALAQIKARRDRARSMSMKKETKTVPGSARRGLVGGIGVRDISAPGRMR